MGAIRGEIFLAIGIVISVVSFFKESLNIFIYIGGVFFIYGLGKIIVQFSRKPTKPATHKQVPPAHPQHSHQSQHTHQHAQHGNHQQKMHPQFHPHSVVQKQQTSGGAQHSVKKCPNCQSVMPHTYRHCPSCGFGF